MSKGDIKSFCRSVLPDNFEQVGQAVVDCQQALQSWLPQRLGTMVRVLTVSAQTVTVSASTPVVANYLRLHQADMQRLLSQTLGSQVTMQVKTSPASLADVELPARPTQPHRLQAKTIDAVASSANAIEDETLRAAMKSLAATLQSATKRNDS